MITSCIFIELLMPMKLRLWLPKCAGSVGCLSGYCVSRWPGYSHVRFLLFNLCSQVSNFVLFSVRKQYVMADRSRICFSAHYVYALLTQGYGFDKNTWKISFKETVSKFTSLFFSRSIIFLRCFVNNYASIRSTALK